MSGEQQPSPVLNPLAAVEEDGFRKRRKKCSVAENRILIERYFHSGPERKGYRQIMVRLREERGLIKVTETFKQVRTELKSNLFTTVELGELSSLGQIQCNECRRVTINIVKKCCHMQLSVIFVYIFTVHSIVTP